MRCLVARRLLQRICVRGELNATFVPKWKATTAYLAGDVVTSPGGDVVTAIADFTAGASYNAANWNLSANYSTPAQAFGNAIAAALIFGA